MAAAGAMASFEGVAKLWWNDSEVKARIKNNKRLIVLHGGKLVAPRDQRHCVSNACVLAPILACMRNSHLIKTPPVTSIEREVHLLMLSSENISFNGNVLPSIPEDWEVPIHVSVSSIKTMVSYVRKVKLSQRIPRDRDLIDSSQISEHLRCFHIIFTSLDSTAGP